MRVNWLLVLRCCCIAVAAAVAVAVALTVPNIALALPYIATLSTV
jgi:hypothetical protein